MVVGLSLQLCSQFAEPWRLNNGSASFVLCGAFHFGLAGSAGGGGDFRVAFPGGESCVERGSLSRTSRRPAEVGVEEAAEPLCDALCAVGALFAAPEEAAAPQAEVGELAGSGRKWGGEGVGGEACIAR